MTDTITTTAAVPSPEVTAAVAVLIAAGIDTPEEFAELLKPPPDPDPHPPTDDPDEVTYAKAVVAERLKPLADAAGFELGTNPGQVDPASWAAAVVERLLAHGLDLPGDWADRPADAALYETYPPKEA